MSKREIRKLVYVAFCGALVILLAKFTRFPPFPWAPYLKLEFGEIPLLLLLMFGARISSPYNAALSAEAMAASDKSPLSATNCAASAVLA